MRLEKQVLRVIRDAYPIPYDPASKKILAIGERPLITDETVHSKCTATLNEVRQAIERLQQFQLIERVYLCDPSEFAQQYVGTGITVRLPLAGRPGGPRGKYIFQITQHGQKEIDELVIERLKRAAWKVVEERGAVLITAAISILGTWFLTRLGLKH
jgi:hypothetical protein